MDTVHRWMGMVAEAARQVQGTDTAENHFVVVHRNRSWILELHVKRPQVLGQLHHLNVDGDGEKPPHMLAHARSDRRRWRA